MISGQNGNYDHPILYYYIYIYIYDNSCMFIIFLLCRVKCICKHRILYPISDLRYECFYPIIPIFGFEVVCNSYYIILYICILFYYIIVYSYNIRYYIIIFVILLYYILLGSVTIPCCIFFILIYILMFICYYVYAYFK